MKKNDSQREQAVEAAEEKLSRLGSRPSESINREDRIKGCLFGLAIGDALGAPVEFATREEIQRKYGPSGIADFEPWGGFPAGSITDDTQMSLATAEGIINARALISKGEKQDTTATYEEAVYAAYQRWLQTQEDPRQRRAPGNTCLEALRSGVMGSYERRINNSKGCGGVMRVAPAGIAFASEPATFIINGSPQLKPLSRAFEMGLRFAAMTHGHPAGYISAGVFADLIARLVQGREIGEDFFLAIYVGLDSFDDNGGAKEWITAAHWMVTHGKDAGPDFEELGRLALKKDDDWHMQTQGFGWTGDEALAVALYCALKYGDDFKGGVLAAANHSGDTDSTASICGALMGARVGINAIPGRWVRSVEGASCLWSLSKMLR